VLATKVNISSYLLLSAVATTVLFFSITPLNFLFVLFTVKTIKEHFHYGVALRCDAFKIETPIVFQFLPRLP